MKILIINGPNINLLGTREPDIYGKDTYEDLCNYVQLYCAEENLDVEFYQSNHEGDIVDKIQASMDDVDGIVLNPAAYTHTSVAIADTLKAVCIPTVEVHISNIDEREDFRKISYVSSVCLNTIIGKGFKGYTEAIEILRNYIIDLKES